MSVTEQTKPEDTQEPVVALDTGDRCDRCGSQAYIRATMRSGFDLLFCNHHYKFHGPALKEKVTHIHDESVKALAK